MDRAMRAAAAICWIVVALTAAGPAWGQRSGEARRHFVEGRRLFKLGKYDRAVRSFNAAYKLRPSPVLDYNIGRCQAELGQRGLAVAAFKRYLEARPNATNREEVLDRIAKLEAAAKPPPEEPAPPPDRPTPTPPATAAGAKPTVPPTPPPAAATPPTHEAALPPRVPPPGAVEEPGVAPIEGQRGQKVAGGAPPVHEATLPPAGLGSGRRPRGKPRSKARTKPQSRPPDKHLAPGHSESGPFYKQWWFWVGCAAGAVIVGFIIGTAASRSDSDATPQRAGGLQITF